MLLRRCIFYIEFFVEDLLSSEKKSISTCFTCECKTRFHAKYPTLMLWQYTLWMETNLIFTYAIIILIHITSNTVYAKDLYSASLENLETILCLPDFQDINEWLKYIHHPSILLLSSVQVAQSTSVYAVKLRLSDLWKYKP